MFVVENYFRDMFVAFFIYFLLTIETFGWDCLFYQPTLFEVPNLVEEFYDGFVKSDISNDDKSFKLKW